MKYRKGYKYQLASDLVLQTTIFPVAEVKTRFITLSINGVLTIKRGYAWDGASGLAIDRKSNMAASAGHDALYQLMRMNLLGFFFWQKADDNFGRWMEERGAWSITVKAYMFVLSLANGHYANPANAKKVYEVE